MDHILSLSYGKDSMACLGALDILGWPLTRIVTSDVWATDTIPAGLPPMVAWKATADASIKERWGIKVEHVRGKYPYQDCFYMVCGAKSKYAGNMGKRATRGLDFIIKRRLKNDKRRKNQSL